MPVWALTENLVVTLLNGYDDSISLIKECHEPENYDLDFPLFMTFLTELKHFSFQYSE